MGRAARRLSVGMAPRCSSRRDTLGFVSCVVRDRRNGGNDCKCANDGSVAAKSGERSGRRSADFEKTNMIQIIFCCPECSGDCYGSSGVDSVVLMRHCHGKESRPGNREQWPACGYSWPSTDDWRYMRLVGVGQAPLRFKSVYSFGEWRKFLNPETTVEGIRA